MNTNENRKQPTSAKRPDYLTGLSYCEAKAVRAAERVLARRIVALAAYRGGLFSLARDRKESAVVRARIDLAGALGLFNNAVTGGAFERAVDVMTGPFQAWALAQDRQRKEQASNGYTSPAALALRDRADGLRANYENGLAHARATADQARRAAQQRAAQGPTPGPAPVWPGGLRAAEPVTLDQRGVPVPAMAPIDALGRALCEALDQAAPGSALHLEIFNAIKAAGKVSEDLNSARRELLKTAHKACGLADVLKMYLDDMDHGRGVQNSTVNAARAALDNLGK